MNKVTVNNKVFEVDGMKIDGAEVIADIIKTGDRFRHVIQNGRSFRVEIMKMDATTKTATLKINESVYEIQVRDKFDLLLEQMGLGGSGGKKISNLKAPMPGLVIDIRVQPGQPVKKGDAVIVLEAMKMENVLKAAGDGIVKNIKAVKGKNVEKGEALIEFE